VSALEQNRKGEAVTTRRRILVALVSANAEELVELSSEGIEVVICDRKTRILTMIATASTDMLILPPTDEDGISLVPIIRAARRQVPKVALFIRESESHVPLRLPVFAQAGANVFLFEGQQSFADLVRSVVALLPPAVDPASFLDRLGIDATSEIEPLVTALAGSGARLRPDRLASLMGCSRRTLNRRLHRAGLPNATDTCALASVMSWAALLEAEMHESVPQPAWLPTALRRLLQLSPREFAERSREARWQMLRRAVDRRRYTVGKRAP
jgi:hypothetical protein